MLVKSQNFNYRHWSICLILLTTLALSSCGKKAEDNTANNNAGDTTTQTGTGNTASAPDGTTKAGTKDGYTSKSAAGSGAISAEARKLGVKPTGTTCPANAPIKGNVNKKSNKKIYHEAKEAGYDKIKPELCFADTTTAQKAGFVARKVGAPKASKTP